MRERFVMTKTFVKKAITADPVGHAFWFTMLVSAIIVGIIHNI